MPVPLGRRIRLIAPDPTTLGGGGAVTEYAYDSSNRLTSVKAPDADGAAGSAYNAAITSYQYDNLGRLAKETLPNKTNGSATGGPETTYTRDLLGRVLEVHAPQSLLTIYEYDKLGRVASVFESGQPTRAFWYDALGNLEYLGENCHRAVQIPPRVGGIGQPV